MRSHPLRTTPLPGADDLGSALADLRTTLQAATDFKEPWEQFHDGVVEHPDFMETGHPEDNVRLVAVMEALGTKVFGRKQAVGPHVFLLLAEHHFWHGTIQLGAHHAAFFYFDDIDVGLCGMLRSLAAPQLDLLRFSLVSLPEGVIPSRHRGQT